MSISRRTQIGVAVLLAALAALPLLGTLLFIHHYGVNARYCDDWWFFTELLLKSAHGQLHFADLFAQYNESRTVFPRLVIIALERLTHGDLRSQYYFSAAMAAAIALNLFILSKRHSSTTPRPPLPLGERQGEGLSRNAPASPLRSLLLLSLATIQIFSPVQYQTWLWGVQIVVFFPMFALTLALLAAESRLSNWPKVLLCAAICLFATFSHANGMLLWPLIGIALIARTSWPSTRRAPAVFWIALTLASLLAYFHGYTKPYWTPRFLPAFKHPLTTLHFFFALLGMPLAWGLGGIAISAATVLGIVQVLVFLIAIYRIIRRDGWRGPALPWLVFAAHVLLTAALTAAGRGGFGVGYAATLRYTSYSLFITVAIIYLVPAAFGGRQLVWKICAVVAVFLTVLTLAPARGQAEWLRAKYLAGRAGLHYILVLPNVPQPGDLLSPGDKELSIAAARLDDIGYLHPPLARTAAVTGAHETIMGRLDQCSRSGDALLVSGVARLPNRAADAVVIAARAGKEVTAIAVVPLDDPAALGRFRANVPAAIPGGTAQIVGYAVDGYTGELYPLEGAFAVP